jgi:molybdopterin synthase sulfur carrier subunit
MEHAMQINVKLFATFRVGRFAVEAREYAPGTRVVDVIRDLQIPEAQIGMIMLNNKHAEPDQALNDGDTLSLFPLVGGG